MTSQPPDTPTAAAPPDPLAGVLAGFTPDVSSNRPPRIQKAVFLARYLQQRAAQLQTPQERRQQAELNRMIQDPHDKATLVQLTDQAFRTSMPQRAVDQVVYILDAQGIPRFFSPLDRTLLRGFQSFGSYLPGVAVPLVKEKMHKETANVILPAERDMLIGHLEHRRREGIRMNVNFLGETVLGEEEAQRRLEGYLEALQFPEIECISVKISTLYSQIAPLARRHTVKVLCDRLELLFRAAAKATFTRADGTDVPKFVYLDMEEFRDMALTAEVFMQTLSRKELEHVAAGIALQSYLPDAYPMLRNLFQWARRRVRRGGAPPTVRVVKGANMEMERVEASLMGWPQAPFQQKIDTDANFKRMLHFATQGDHLNALRLGVASHNLIDMAYALVLAHENHAMDKVQFEMLEGMANHQRRALFELSHNVLLYAPACRKENFINAIGYLIRRLDENTGPENFLRHAFRLTVDSDDWRRLEADFVRSFEEVDTLSEQPRRTQDRNAEPLQPTMPDLPAESTTTFAEVLDAFPNEPDTDFALPHNGLWAQGILDDWRVRCDSSAVEAPLVVAGESRYDNRGVACRRDPSRPGVVASRVEQGTVADAERAVACARDDEDGWRTMTPAARSDVLRRAAHELRKARAELIGAALAEGGKTITESDPEVSEAVDFVEFYNLTAQCFTSLPGVDVQGLGVVAVIPPWNFPIAIPCGGVAAGLAAGNTVILKPALETACTAHRICECFWRAGVSQKSLQFLPCPNPVAQQLATHDGVDALIFTGGTATALTLLRAKPDVHLFAETGGKNATIVTALADRDQAIRNVVRSAFSHSGQKCSATSLLLLEREVFENADFKDNLCDAIRSVAVGSAWDLNTRIGPLIRPPAEKLQRALKELEPGESWAVMPHQLEDNPQLYSPGVKWNVQPGSFTHLTELFGPVLGVMPFDRLDDAIALVAATGYGLTAGLESLDAREQEHWIAETRAGNLYVNRGTTGAIVLRQPFGGMGKSAVGPGIKAGGPNYVAQFMRFNERSADPPTGQVDDPFLRHLQDDLMHPNSGLPDLDAALRARLAGAIAGYDEAGRSEFHRQHDHALLVGQDNFRRYLPLHEMRVRVHPADSPSDLFARVAAAKAARCRITVSLPTGFRRPDVAWLDRHTREWGGSIELLEESDEQLAHCIRYAQTDRVRYAAPDRVPEIVRRAAAETGFYLADRPVLPIGRIELLNYLREQSLSINYHRYGNLGERAAEPRRQPA